MAKSKDLFDESTMSFGEHLEVLRIHLWKSIIGLVLCVVFTLVFGKQVIAFVSSPIKQALRDVNGLELEKEGFVNFELWPYIKEKLGFADEQKVDEATKKKRAAEEAKKTADPKTILAKIKAIDLYSALEDIDPELVAKAKKPDDEKMVEMKITADEFGQLRSDVDDIVDKQNEPITLNVQEAFVTYLKVAIISGFVLASPWIFYQTWLFVAAGLYPHEKRYVHIFLPLSITLFVGGALFCFYLVFPFVLKFLLSFNESMEIAPQIRLSEWISFAVMLPVMFGISFQLPLVMLFLDRLHVFSAEVYRTKRRVAILVIAIISMLLTPADPMSMILMMVPLVILYEFGILLCGMRPAKSPFPEAET